jgi:hypothetical protein
MNRRPPAADPPTIAVTPIYGWGWVIGGETSPQVPEPFTLRLDESGPARWAGIVLGAGHVFEGRRAVLSPRHAEWTGDVDIIVEPADAGGQPAYGYGMLAGPPASWETRST